MRPIETRQLRAASELLLAATIWGFGFIATIWALKSVDPISMSLLRFGVAFLVGYIGFWVWQKRAGTQHLSHRSHLIHSIRPGIFLSLTLGLQTWGLLYTSATNSGFITTLYVVIVPIVESLMFRRRLPLVHIFWVFLALLGTALMLQLHLEPFNKGDLLTLACAICAALQIIEIGRVQKHIESPFLFNAYQSLWAFVGTFLLWPFYGKLYFHTPNMYAIAGLLSLTFGSTLLAFALQIKAQKFLSPSLASIIFLLESPFAAIFAWLLLKDQISLTQTIGGLVIFIAAGGATYTERR